ncbi:MAG: LytR C-terminal domain-containing protein [Candidatus Shapirobacteria bacterium]
MDIKQILLIVLIVVVGLGLVGGGIWVSKKALSNKETTSPVAETPIETSEPAIEEVTPTPSLMREDLKVEILNGSGVAGLAAQASQYLEGLGYQEVKTANAGKYDYAETVIQIKESQKSYLEMVKEDVSKKYPLASEIENLEEESEFDIVIILGKK